MSNLTLLYQLTENLGADEEIRFAHHSLGLRIHRTHGDMHSEHIVSWLELERMRDPEIFLSSILEKLALDLRSIPHGLQETR